MKLAIAPLASILAALAFAALPLMTSSNYIIGVGISALIFTVAAAALNLTVCCQKQRKFFRHVRRHLEICA